VSDPQKGDKLIKHNIKSKTVNKYFFLEISVLLQITSSQGISDGGRGGRRAI
jgi:hypothetical protein